jgi:hypothetical protein
MIFLSASAFLQLPEAISLIGMTVIIFYVAILANQQELKHDILEGDLLFNLVMGKTDFKSLTIETELRIISIVVTEKVKAHD